MVDTPMTKNFKKIYGQNLILQKLYQLKIIMRKCIFEIWWYIISFIKLLPDKYLKN